MVTIAATILLLSGKGATSKGPMIDLYFARSADGKTIYDDALHITVTKPAEVDKVLSYFHGFKNPNHPMKPAGWSAWGWVTLHANGKEYKGNFSSDCSVWSRPGTYGDFEVKDGLRPLLIQILKRNGRH